MNDAPGPEKPAENATDVPDGSVEATADLVVAFAPGVMPGKWFSRWRDRHPGLVLAERPLEADTWREELEEGRAHACFVRLPAHPRTDVDDLPGLRRRFRAVEVYAEQQVVVLPRDHELTLLDAVPVAELADEVLLQEPETLPERQRLRRPEAVAADAPLPPMRHTRDAVELVAAGLGLLVVPMSLARLHRRKDLVHRVVPDAATVPVALVWRQDLPVEREELVQDFVGVVRGRGLNSSRGADPARTPAAEGARGGTVPAGTGASPPRRASRPRQAARRRGGARGGTGGAGRSGGRGRR